ncbi:SAM-dependent methyltransferase [Serinibacter arcticus]|uniref:SAM-dependent methyltransferase n=1 Tax=Serinibacter arcticus TaxID=1655435 RepID=A0A2U1ZV20_9MICO|nr:class I SAM-dependent methyltransferase [Serinibacter arcticus]PWD50790.1 SAM-dependent methyltransferase [Serinibacter arcticus]
MSADHYDDFAASYDAENQASLLNTFYNKPAILDLAGDVAGHRVLDVGCGSGPIALALHERGALVTGLDGSPAMLAIARERLGEDVPLHVGDLAQPLPFDDDAFDDVVASLVLHYLEDWGCPLAEIRRVLRPGGRFVVSINHPTVRVVTHPDDGYFETYRYTETFEFDGRPAALTMWHRPLRDVLRAFTDAGFRILVVDEPAPSPDTPAELLPPRIASGERSAFLCFLFLVLEAA